MTRHQWRRHAFQLALVAGFSVPTIASGQGIPAAHIPVSTTLGDIAKLRTAYGEAWNAKDAKAVNAMYTSDATAIDVDGSVVSGWKAIAKKNEDAAPNWPHTVITSQSVKLYGTTAVDVGTVAMHPKEGGEMMYHYLVVLRHGVNGWKLQDIAVAPIPK
jgi:uncharacterized protein (TIGR02246 family)